MLKQHSTIVRRLVIGADLLLLGGTFIGAFALRFQRLPTANDWRDYGWITLIFIPTLIFNLYRAGIYHKLRYLSGTEIGKRLGLAFAITFAVASSALFLSHATHYSRLLLLYFTGLSALLLTGTKLIGKLIIDHIRSRGANFRSVLLVGRGAKLKRLETIFRPGNPYGLKIAKIIDLECHVDNFSQILTSTVIDEVYFAVPRSPQGPTIDPYLKMAEAAGKTCKIILNINENRLSKCEFSRLEELPLVVLHPVTLDPDQILIKRCFDIAGGLIGIAINLLLFPLIATAIKLDSPGPIFFRQPRVGENGRIFILYKYRSMFQNAESRKPELLEHNELKGAVFKITNDPRITKTGRILRKSSLDEIPQFWNVLGGHMSLVGTRPPTSEEVQEYDLHHHRRLSIKPGITGLWQVSGRNKIIDFDEIVKLDTQYIDQWSLWLDCKILSKTFKVIWSGN